MGSNASTKSARVLRARSTPPERVVWKRLRGRRLNGLKFRRQHPFGPYVLDFFCHSALLTIEVDGRRHEDRREADAARDRWLASQGVMVLRFTAGQVSSDLEAVLATILRRARERTAADGDPPSPFGRGPG
ncbi:MAG: DUF559 domain-containing protein [Planctomycetota bacterium]